MGLMKIKQLPKFNRPREKMLEKGIEALRDEELLAILLRTGYQGQNVVQVARRILKTYNLDKLFHLPLTKLIALKGVGRSRATTIKACYELVKRALNNEKELTIDSPKDVAKLVSNLRDKKREYLIALLLTARNTLILRYTVSIGTLTANLVHPREVFAPAIENKAAQIIIVHNHPSGRSEPSEEDKKVTKKLIKVGEIIDIQVIDHIIVSKNGFFSFKEKRLI